MAGIKIYELAREVGMPSKDLAAWAKKEGFSVKTHMSSVDEKTTKEIRKGLKKAGLPAESKSAVAKKVSTKKAQPKKKAEPKKAAAKTATKTAKAPGKKTKPKVKPSEKKGEAALTDIF